MKSLWDKYLEKERNIILHKDETLLHWYASINDIESCKDYLSDVNVPDFRGNTPFMIACLKGNMELVKIMLNNGADKYLKDFSGKDYYFKTYSHENNSPDRYKEIVKYIELDRFVFYEQVYKQIDKFYNYLKQNDLERDLKEVKFNINTVNISFKSEISMKHFSKIIGVFTNSYITCTKYDIGFTIFNKEK